MLHYNQKKYIHTFFMTVLCSVNILCLGSFAPMYIGNYRIQAPKNRNTIITNLEHVCPDAIVETLAHIMQPNSANKKIVATITSIHDDLGTHKSIFLIKLIRNLGLKTGQNSANIALFIHKQKQMYNRKYKDGNVDKTANFFVAFNDAKIVFYFLAPIQNKILNNEFLIKNEYNYLLKNIHLIDWKLFNNMQINVKKTFFECFHEIIMQNGGYFNNFKYSIIFLGAISSGSVLVDINPLIQIIGSITIGGTAGFRIGTTAADIVTHAVAPNRRVTITFEQDNETVALEEDMDTIIEEILPG